MLSKTYFDGMDEESRQKTLMRIEIGKKVQAQIKQLNLEYSPRINELKEAKKKKWDAIYAWRDSEYERLGL